MFSIFLILPFCLIIIEKVQEHSINVFELSYKFDDYIYFVVSFDFQLGAKGDNIKRNKKNIGCTAANPGLPCKAGGR